ncbi:hypothetical protein P9A09_00445 [Serratia marcescens]|uniref:hypothetical protein n=1 Tax=Serratia TaxID=613 RepID=UPI001395D749|nr:hypothetical protein [Serratia marcescens]ELH4240784.1 hypothetical protein [Serratia marcescens]ELN4520609.1 hypothetical protein [Serratia marcescens]ELY3100817.1 hypothetical protein [Serratia marcescens]MBH3243679.1 hypothetical protein [Serratia marcescens]MBI6149700.1 hypothetical protein [Serratia marcescens]
MNDTPIKKYFTEQLLSGVLASNDPDCCAEYFMGNLLVGRILPSKEQRPRARVVRLSRLMLREVKSEPRQDRR